MADAVPGLLTIGNSGPADQHPPNVGDTGADGVADGCLFALVSHAPPPGGGPSVSKAAGGGASASGAPPSSVADSRPPPEDFFHLLISEDMARARGGC